MIEIKHLSLSELEAGLDHIRQSPKDGGVLELIVRRPLVDVRELSDVGELNFTEGLAGDSWNCAGKFSIGRWIAASRHATQHHECPGDFHHRAVQGPLAVGRRPAIHRFGIDRRQLASGSASGSRFRSHRDYRGASLGLP